MLKQSQADASTPLHACRSKLVRKLFHEHAASEYTEWSDVGILVGVGNNALVLTLQRCACDRYLYPIPDAAYMHT